MYQPASVHSSVYTTTATRGSTLLISLSAWRLSEIILKLVVACCGRMSCGQCQAARAAHAVLPASLTSYPCHTTHAQSPGLSWQWQVAVLLNFVFIWHHVLLRDDAAAASALVVKFAGTHACMHALKPLLRALKLCSARQWPRKGPTLIRFHVACGSWWRTGECVDSSRQVVSAEAACCQWLCMFVCQLLFVCQMPDSTATAGRPCIQCSAHAIPTLQCLSSIHDRTPESRTVLRFNCRQLWTLSRLPADKALRLIPHEEGFIC